MSILNCSLIIVLSPLIAAILSGFLRSYLGHNWCHGITISGMLLSFCLSIYTAFSIWLHPDLSINTHLYTWASADIFPFEFSIGFLIDSLTVTMLLVVSFVSLLVHIYSIGYMADDDGYGRFFSYISLFTFMMLTLVTANNFLQLFFGWEGVGLVSYLLIGFWYQKEAAISGSLKAFIVNRVGDFGFILGIAFILAQTGSLSYDVVFGYGAQLAKQSFEWIPGLSCSMATLVCILLFIGAMAKSAQVPLHVWLPESMEGPTPISALIHAATMVTAGVFMLARISPLLEYSPTALSFILIIGATGALFTGLIAIVMDDIKRVVAYSTLSQLGYMMVAMGLSAYSAGIFHLVTHACFKALLFLAAGSVIMAMHHDQDMKNMGGLWKKMPITYLCFLIGSLALCAVPPFSGFFSKDTIIEAAGHAEIWGSQYAYYCTVLGALVTSIYSFRAIMLTFHGENRSKDKDVFEHATESPWVVVLPLIVLAIPSIFIGYFLYFPLLFNEPSLLQPSIFVLPEHNILQNMGEEVHSAADAVLHAPESPVFWLSIFGILGTCLAYSRFLFIPDLIKSHLAWPYQILIAKYGIDDLNQKLWVNGTKSLGEVFYNIGDKIFIDGFVVNGSCRFVQMVALKVRAAQNGFLYNYITWMVFGLILFILGLSRFFLIS